VWSTRKPRPAPIDAPPEEWQPTHEPAAPDSERWCHTFAAIYSYRQGCSLADALDTARMVFSSLGELPPSDAVTTIVFDPKLSHAVAGRRQDRR